MPLTSPNMLIASDIMKHHWYQECQCTCAYPNEFSVGNVSGDGEVASKTEFVCADSSWSRKSI